jgi:hypothetical protein
MLLNDKRPCDTCIFMADSCHEDMCLHPLRRDPGAAGKALENALLWNGNCPVTMKGEPCFYGLLDSADDFAARRTNAERIRQKLTVHFNQTGTLTADDLRAAIQLLTRVSA